jgi:hypothetical protein
LLLLLEAMVPVQLLSWSLADSWCMTAKQRLHDSSAACDGFSPSSYASSQISESESDESLVIGAGSGSAVGSSGDSAGDARAPDEPTAMCITCSRYFSAIVLVTSARH